jgi:DNA-binding SARP family transcriptional activator/tetratricopeptide (TPR) repeat protein
MFPEIDRLLLQRSDQAENRGEFSSTIQKAREEVGAARSKPPSQLAQALLNLAQLLSRAGEYREAQLSAQDVMEIEGTGPIAAEALITFGICAAETEDLDKAEDALYRAADHCRKIGYKAGLARALHNLSASVLITRGKFNLALDTMEEAHAIRSELGMKDWGWPWIRTHIHLITGNRRRARQALDEMVREIEPATRNAGGYYFLWARLALDEGEFDKAHEYLRLCMRIATQTGVPDLNLWMRIEQSRYYRKTNRIPEAREWAEDAIHLAQRYHYRYFEALALYELSLVEWESGESPSAAQRLGEAEGFFNSFNATYDLAVAAYTRALWDHLLDSPTAAVSWVIAAAAIEHGGYAFLLEKEQETAFSLIASHLRGTDLAAREASERILRQLARVQPPALRIAGLGQFSVWKGRSLIPERSWLKRKAGELFRFLLIQPHRSAGKEAILEALWPDHGLDSGNDLLHQSTSALRRILEPDLPDKFPSRYLSYEGEQISLVLPQGSSIDFEIFRQEIQAAIQSKDSDRLQDSVNLYMGELFPADRYASWSSEYRESVLALYQNGILELAQIYFSQRQYADTLDCCRTLLRLDPLNEEACLLAMRCHIELGTAIHAMRIFQILEQNLMTELGLEPSVELRDLARSLKAR